MGVSDAAVLESSRQNLEDGKSRLAKAPRICIIQLLQYFTIYSLFSLGIFLKLINKSCESVKACFKMAEGVKVRTGGPVRACPGRVFKTYLLARWKIRHRIPLVAVNLLVTIFFLLIYWTLFCVTLRFIFSRVKNGRST